MAGWGVCPLRAVLLCSSLGASGIQLPGTCGPVLCLFHPDAVCHRPWPAWCSEARLPPHGSACRVLVLRVGLYWGGRHPGHRAVEWESPRVLLASLHYDCWHLCWWGLEQCDFLASLRFAATSCPVCCDFWWSPGVAASSCLNQMLGWS